jgi:hypothetical protein
VKKLEIVACFRFNEFWLIVAGADGRKKPSKNWREYGRKILVVAAEPFGQADASQADAAAAAKAYIL